ncbi:hypothetical protein HYH03_011447 [Edaphochlamys debaryana]|uniref:Uncharacterized protein n=1 Tax=Edaphochlamys debaryana TaxID=47281 RepID=A0A835XTU4_9CHLO|nr:hypothetical protein HYH03_011447 [Edaphochlamys debaryana]|eukprot:KAG2490143.1 hypothetical protein HYH03_011447 [Edaphochlamys debaryana]
MATEGEPQATLPTDDGSATVWTVVVAVFGIVGGILLWAFIQHRRMVASMPARPRKKLGAKQLKREKLKMGLRPAGDD